MKSQHSMSTQELEAFTQKLTKWTASLSDNERTFFRFMIERNKELTSDKLDQVTGGATFSTSFSTAFTFQTYAPQLDASWFRIMCW